MDAVFDSVAATEPAFAGSYLNEAGQLVIAVAGSLRTDAAQLAARVGPVKRLNSFGQPLALLSSTASPTIQTVAFSWKELIWAKDQVLSLGDDHALSSVDADEKLNRVVVGVVAAADTAAVRQALRASGVIDGIATLRVEPRASTVQALFDRVRPIRGGLEIGPKGCTATVVARWNGTPVLLTASHCTSTMWGLDAGPTSQNLFGTLFGAEVHDLNVYRCGPAINRRDCRRADLAAFSVLDVDVFPGESAFSQGQIYRTTERLQGLQGLSAAKTIDLQSPTISFEGTVERVPVGWVLERIGVTNGWQTGAVFESCVDRWINTPRRIMLVCQTGGHLNSDPGDSGSPVFALLANGNALFAGITWGSTQGGTNAFFSDVTQMRQEMSGLVFTP
jgi:hypothetical protein